MNVMNLVWPVLLVGCRALYFAYSLWCLLFPLAALWLLAYLAQGNSLLGLQAGVWGYVLLASLLVFALLVVLLVSLRRVPDEPNAFQSAFLSWFGTLRGFWNTQAGDMVKFRLPSGYLVENPGAYRIGGSDIQHILEHIQPGDVLLRGFDGYLDGFLIRHASVCSAKDFQPGWFTHAALYMGALTEADRSQVPPAYQHNADYFQTGSHMLIHAMAKGVHSQNLLTFCRCDYLVVLRIKQGAVPLDVAGVVQAARQSALEKIGDGYDFDASDTTTFSRFSCSELVYYCLRSVQSALQLTPQPHALYPLSPLNKRLAILKRVTIVPDDFYALLQSGGMECIWSDPVSARQKAPTRP
jgi:hypothetical protein